MIKYINGFTGNEIAGDLRTKLGLTNNATLFSTDNGIEGKFCKGGSGPRLEIFGPTGHICGCSLEQQMDWGSPNKETGQWQSGFQYGHFNLPSLTLKELIAYLVPQWRTEARGKMQNALRVFEGVELLQAGFND